MPITNARPRRKLFAPGGDLPYYNDPTSFAYKGKYPTDFTPASTRPGLPPLSIDPDKSAGLTVPQKSVNAPFDWKGTLQQGAKYAQDITPYVSNIVNSFRRVPTPTRPTMDSAPVLQKVDMTAERNAASREVNAATVGADRAMDGNTAEKVRQYNVGQKLNALSSINSQERNQNTQIGNQQAMMNAQTASGNNQKMDQWHDDIKEGQIAQSREQSANLSNAADKAVGIRNEKEKGRVELEKANVLAQLYSSSGVLNRSRMQMRAAGIKDPMDKDYKDLPPEEDYVKPVPMSGSIKRYGGNIKLKP